MKNRILTISTILFLALIFNMCKSDYGISSKLLQIELVADGNISQLGGEFFLRISTNESWKIEKPNNDTWYSFSSVSGNGTNTIILKINANDSEQRTGSFYILAGKEKRTVEFIQEEYDVKMLYYPVDEAYRIEMPRLSTEFVDNEAAFVVHVSADNVGDTTLNYSLEYNYASHHSRWVAFTFYDRTSEVNTKRSNAWSTDPYLLDYTDNTYDFRASGYDRGHLVASADRLYSVAANEQTFYYSNMSPQINSFNGGIWASLEKKVQDWGKLSAIRDTLYVAKGGAIRDDQVMGAIGENKIVIPKYYFMAILAKKGSTYKSIAFLLEHRAHPRPYSLSDYALSVEELEEHTGIDFFHNLPDSIELIVEKQKNFADWPDL